MFDQSVYDFSNKGVRFKEYLKNTNDTKSIVTLVLEGYKVEDKELADVLNSFIDNTKSIRELFHDVRIKVIEEDIDYITKALLYNAWCSIITRDDAEEFVKVIKYLDIDDKYVNDVKTLEDCSFARNYEMIDVLLEYGYSWKIDGNLIRSLVYNNRLEIAEVFIKHGYRAPEVISMFNINNHLKWDPDRIQFLIKHGTKIEINLKESKALDIIANSDINCIYTKEAMEVYLKLHPGVKMRHAYMTESAYFIYDEKVGIKLMTDTESTVELLISDVNNNEQYKAKKYNTGWYIVKEEER